MNSSQNRIMVIGAIVAGALILLFNTVYMVEQRQQVLVLSLGRPIRMVNEPGKNEAGLHIKTPFVENVVRFDKRNIALETQGEEINAAGQTRLVVDAFVRYRISNPLQFYTAHQGGSMEVAAKNLEGLTTSALREALGRAQAADIISLQRVALMQQITAAVARNAKASRYGIEILDVRIKRADLPDSNREAVYRSMEAARRQEAQEIRAIGKQRASETISNAKAQEGQIRGEADAQRAQMFASSYGKDARFAAFYRSMRAYEESMASGDTTLVLSPDSEFFRYFRQGPGG